MFSSDQIFEISGSMSQLEETISFAMKMSGWNKTDVYYQITKDGRFCLGWHNESGWEKFMFDYNPHIISEIVKQHLDKQDCKDPYAYSDGSSGKGFLMKVIPNMSGDYDGIKNAFYGIVSIEPFMNFYAK